jgi:hypothetical protein
VPSGTVIASYAPAGSWHLDVGGRAATQYPAYGWAAQYSVGNAGSATLAFDGSPLVPLGLLAELALWLAVAAALIGRRRTLDWWWGRWRRDTEQEPAATAVVGEPSGNGLAEGAGRQPADRVPSGDPS